MLVLEIEYLQHVSYAAKYNSPDEPEWPPHPDRVFMALVDAWGVAGRSAAGADALRWLESQEPPEIAAQMRTRAADSGILCPPQATRHRGSDTLARPTCYRLHKAS